MANLKKYDFSGKEIGEVQIEDKLLDLPIKHKMIKDYIVAICKNKRQWSANTKTRSEVKATGKKPHQQKGLGRARQGSLVAPHFKGGGVAFGPKPKFNQHVRINKKERRFAIKSLLAERIRENRVCIVEDVLEKPKTKTVFNFLKKLKIDDKRVLVLTGDNNFRNIQKSVKNIPKKHFCLISNVNGYELARSLNIVIVGSGEKITAIFEKGDK